MQFNVGFIATALLASASLAMSAKITGFAGAGCTGEKGETFKVSAGECFTLGHGSTKSIHYTGVTSEIKFYISGGGHDSCTNGAHTVRVDAHGCATAPAGAGVCRRDFGTGDSSRRGGSLQKDTIKKPELPEFKKLSDGRRQTAAILRNVIAEGCYVRLASSGGGKMSTEG
ncbi:hypothetical protein C8R45DRAFT_923580 [Mycena sanguinolenta]|nr:hypothetical protein C8R45DRAFT_923580 [Mycena sanguinolenta]